MNKPIGSILLICGLFSIVAESWSREVFEARVTRVWDGDTISVQADGRDYRIRLAGIDAPEHDQPYGQTASRRLTGMLDGKSVRIESSKTDRYGRLVAKVWVEPADCRGCGKTLDAGMGMLTTGLAWWYRYYKKDQSIEDRERYEFAEYEAKAKRAGLWQDDNPIPPWDWPRGDRAATRKEGCVIKGNISPNGRIYHLPGQKGYEQTRISPSKGERWFCSEAEAREAGWRKSKA